MTLSEVPSADAVLVHRRSVEYDAFDAGDELIVVGRLRDTRPWADDGDAPATVHEMELRVRVAIPDLTIVEATARMDTFPHAECPGIVGAFAQLEGLSVTRGYTREVQARFAGPKGCTHLEQLARALGPVVVQAVTSRRARAVSTGQLDNLLAGGGSPWARDSCHIWVEGGIADQKLAAGWRPGTGPYPAPPLETFTEPGATG
ncbi:MAG: DUF2889 domain-containing protein [Acidimicrobiales bacterium]